MLILTRKPGESVYIGDDVKITIVEIKGHQIRVGIDAPKELRIYREEIYLQILEENKEAASADDSGLEGLSDAWKSRVGKPSAKGLSALKSRPVKAASEQKASGKSPEVVVKRKKKSSDE